MRSRTARVTRFAHERAFIATELTLSVLRTDPVKIARRDDESRHHHAAALADQLRGGRSGPAEQTRHRLHTRQRP
jgi:hypothetical protein